MQTPIGPYPRIVRVSVTRPDGRRRWRLVKTTRPDRDPGSSIFGLNAALAKLTIDGDIIGSATSVPANITDGQRLKLLRWQAALAAMLA